MDVDRISRFLRDLKAQSWDVFDLAVLDAAGHVIASTDTAPARSERLAVLLAEVLTQAITVSALSARGQAESVFLKYAAGYLCAVPILSQYFYMMEMEPGVRLGFPTPASPHLARPYLREMLDERISRYLHNLKVASPDVFNLAVIGTGGHVMASTDPELARSERLAAFISQSDVLRHLTKRRGVYTATLNFENAHLVLVSIGRWYSTHYTYVMEMNTTVKLERPTPASPYGALPGIYEIFVEKLVQEE